MTDTPDTPQDDERGPLAPLEVILGIVVLVIAVGAYLALVLTGHEDSVDKLLGLLAPVVGAVFIVGAQSRSHQRTSSKLTDLDAKVRTVVRQTNGVLDDKIRNGARDATLKALEEYDLSADVKKALSGLLEGHLAARAEGAEVGDKNTGTPL